MDKKFYQKFKFNIKKYRKKTRLEGLEPSTSRAVIWHSNPTELQAHIGERGIRTPGTDLLRTAD